MRGDPIYFWGRNEYPDVPGSENLFVSVIEGGDTKEAFVFESNLEHIDFFNKKKNHK